MLGLKIENFSLPTFFLVVIFCACLFIGVFPSLLFRDFPVYDQWRIAILIALFSISNVFFFSRSQFTSQHNKYWLVGLSLAGAILVSGIFSASFAKCSIISLWEVVFWVCFSVLAIVIASIVCGRTDNIVSAIAFFACVFFCILNIQFIVALFASFGNAPFDYQVFFIDTPNIRFFNQIQTLCLPLVYWVRFSRFNRYAWADITFVLSVVVLFSTGARGSLAGLVFGSALVAVLGMLPRRILVRFYLYIFIGFVLYLFLVQFLPYWLSGSVLDLSVRTSSSGRLYLWSESIKLFSDNLLGIGPLGFAYGVRSNAGHPHNFIVQTLLEWGVGGFAVLLFIGYLFLRSIRAFFVFKKNVTLQFGLTVMSLFSALSYGLLSGVLGTLWFTTALLQVNFIPFSVVFLLQKLQP